MKKISIKREQSQVGLSFAEREKFRPQVKIKLLLLLVLLAAVVTGAWAQTETLLTTITATGKKQASYSTANVATVSFSYTAGGSSEYLANWGWWGYNMTLTVTPAEGYTITKCVFYDDANRTATDSEVPFVVETIGDNDKTPRINGTPIDGGNMQSKGIKKIEVYGYATPATTGYSITLDEGTGNKDSQNWEITPKSSELSGGEDVTVKYNGSREVKSVTVVKKAAAVRALAKATSEDLGKIAGADGKIYATKADAEAANTTAVAMIAYVGSDTGNDTYTHGMALALSDEGEMNWSPAKSTCEGKSAVSGAAWLLPSRNQWKAMFKANGGNEGSYTGLNTAVATAGGDSSKLQMNERYWTSSELDADWAWVFVLGEVSAGWDGAPKDLGHHVRACLAF